MPPAMAFDHHGSWARSTRTCSTSIDMRSRRPAIRGATRRRGIWCSRAADSLQPAFHHHPPIRHSRTVWRFRRPGGRPVLVLAQRFSISERHTRSRFAAVPMYTSTSTTMSLRMRASRTIGATMRFLSTIGTISTSSTSGPTTASISIRMAAMAFAISTATASTICFSRRARPGGFQALASSRGPISISATERFDQLRLGYFDADLNVRCADRKSLANG